MRADKALSHLYDGELCLAEMKDGTTRTVRWSRQDWCFFHTDTPTPAVCRFEDIKEWRLVTIRL
jgi:hypothetical protein